MPEPAPQWSIQTELHRLLSWIWPIEPEYEPGPWRRVWLIIVYTIRRWLFIDRCSWRSSALSMQTLLSVVPIAGVLLFFVSSLDPDFGVQLLEAVARSLVPEARSSDDFTQSVIRLGENVSFERLGAWGFLGVVILAYWLYSTLERTLNEIWQVSRRRNLLAKFTTFYTIASLAPVLLFYSLAQPVLSQLTNFVLVTPFVTTSVALVITNRLMPNTKVKWSAAVIGGLVSAVLFELSKWLFGMYVSMISMATYEGLYGGSLAVLPVFVVWSYLSWMIVLLGAELAYTIHHMRGVAQEGYVHPSTRQAGKPQLAPGRTAARLLLAIADNYDRRGKGTTVDDLNERFHVGLAPIVSLVDQLEQAEFILAVRGEDGGYIPSRPLEKIRLQDLMDLFSGDLERARNDALADLFGELDDHAEREVGDATFRDLVDREGERRAASRSTPSGVLAVVDDAKHP